MALLLGPSFLIRGVVDWLDHRTFHFTRSPLPTILGIVTPLSVAVAAAIPISASALVLPTRTFIVVSRSSATRHPTVDVTISITISVSVSIFIPWPTSDFLSVITNDGPFSITVTVATIPFPGRLFTIVVLSWFTFGGRPVALVLVFDSATRRLFILVADPAARRFFFVFS
jgi:hypothetical protein